jgi:hypothetical protein
MTRFVKNTSASVGLLFGVTVPVLLGTVALGVDATRQMAAYDNLQRANKLACDQLQLHHALPPPARIAAATSSFTQTIQQMRLKPSTTSVSITGTSTFVIQSQTEIDFFLAKVVGHQTGAASHTLNCASLAPPSASPPGTPCNAILTEEFENPVIPVGENHLFISSFPGWTVVGGIAVAELQNVWSGGAPAQGAQFAELDTDGFNVRMSRTITLAAGDYELRYFYRAEIWNHAPSASHGLRVCIESIASSPCTNAEEHWPTTATWIEHKRGFRIPTGGQFRVSMEGLGTEDSHGAHIDDLRICPR